MHFTESHSETTHQKLTWPLATFRCTRSGTPPLAKHIYLDETDTPNMEDDPLCGFDFSDEEESSTQKDRQAKLNQSEEAFQAEKRLWQPVCQTKQVSPAIPPFVIEAKHKAK